MAGETLCLEGIFDKRRDNTMLGNVLAIGAKLMAEGRLPTDVAESKPGTYAFCLAGRKAIDIELLHQGDSMEVGRMPQGNRQWRIQDPWMSRRHFTVSVGEDGIALLTPLASKNGTFVNDKAVENRVCLNRGDVVRAGSSSFLLL